MVAHRDSASTVRWVECPRDAWQALPVRIPSESKRAHLQSLLDAGFRHLDLGSFVSPRAVPQMADTEEVLRQLDRPEGSDFLCIIGNMRGFERAAAGDHVGSLGYPLSLNETFQLRNTGRDLESSWRLVEDLREACDGADMELVVYISMGFGNPYGEEWSPADTAGAVTRLRDMGIARIAVADTVGRADALLVEKVLAAIDRPRDLGLHLHARPGAWEPLLQSAWQCGVGWFEGALSGAGGCPFAGDALVGNLPSESVLPWLADRGLLTGVQLERLPKLAEEAAELAAYGAGGS
ncbi:MAG: hydroxymethylglutaryl-CoA lyase [Trueperaceae bacterium]